MGIDAGVLEIAAVAASVAGTAVTAYGAESSASAQKSQAEYQAQVAANNATIANQNAKLTSAAGEQSAANQGLKTRAEVGAIKAEQAASGIDVNTGSAVDVRSSAADLGQLNQLTLRSNAARQAYGYETEAAGFTGQSAADVAAGQNAVTAGGISAGSSVLGGLGSAGSNYAKWSLSSGAGAPSGS